METTKPILDVRKNMRMALLKSLLIPALLLVFYSFAPVWLNSKLHEAAIISINPDPNLSADEQQARLDKISQINFRQVCISPSPGQERLHDNLVLAGVAARFTRLEWGQILSAVLVAGLGLAVWSIFSLNEKAKKSQADLIHGYQMSWKIAMIAALAKVFLLIPLLAYGTFEFSILLSGHYIPKLLGVIIFGGLFALWKSGKILLKNIPMEFKEPMSREVTPAEAPELWEAVREAAQRLQTSPPDHIVIGLQFNFYVTELAVVLDSGRTEGKTLYLSFPLLKQLSSDEVMAIIGHELGHFIGEDTRMTREFYPLRFKIRATVLAMAQAGWVGWPSLQFLHFFGWRFGETEQAASRSRELLADRKAAELTSPQTAAKALVRFQVATEAFHRGLVDAMKGGTENPLNIPLQTVVQEKLANDRAFWDQLFEQHTPHPLDSHPPLNVRLESLGQRISVEDARNLALASFESAYAKWFATHGDLFAGLNKHAEAVVGKLRIAQADYQTREGKELLDRHFPEKRWKAKLNGILAPAILLGLAIAGCLAGALFTPALALRVICGVISLCFGGFLIQVWKRNYGAELVLRADSIEHTSWNRPLKFQEIVRTTARRHYSNITLTFHLQEKQPSFWKYGVPGLKCNAVSISVNNYPEKPLVVAQTIFNYVTRQTGPNHSTE